MADDPTNERLSNRLADLRSLGDRQREFHPVSVLRKELSAPPPASTEPAKPVEPAAPSTVPQPHQPPSLEERARTLARRVFSSLLNRAEQQAQRILTERKSAVIDLEKRRELLQRESHVARRPADYIGPDAD